MKSFPAPLLKRIMFTALIGVGCIIFSLAYFWGTKDRICLFLGALVLLCSLYRTYSLYMIIKQGKYEIFEGTCVGVTTKLLGKFKSIRIMDNEGIETTFQVMKNCKFKIGNKYRLYFSNRDQIYTGNNYFDAKLTTGKFLGLESIVNQK